MPKRASINWQASTLEIESSKPRTVQVLLIEDDPAQLADAWGMLEVLGYKITGAGSAEAALGLIGRTRFDVIVTDNILPGITGLQALPRLLASGSPVIVMSSQGGPETEKDALLLGASAFIKKPLTIKTLSKVIRQVLAHAASRPQSLTQPKIP